MSDSAKQRSATLVTARRALEVRGEAVRECSLELAVEEPFALELDGETLAVTMRTPGHDDELTAGFLLAEGHAPGAEAQAPPPRRAALSTAACGVCGRPGIDDLLARLRPVEATTCFARAVLASSMQRLPEHQPGFARSGGLHAAALVHRSGEFYCAREDVGRHNAVDKVLGRAALSQLVPCSEYFLLVSGRTSFEILQKAAMAGVPAVVGVSAPSSLAVEVAERLGMLLIGFARGAAFTVYAGRHRLEAG